MRRPSLPLALALAIAGCATIHLDPPADLSAAPAWELASPGLSLTRHTAQRLGPYVVRDLAMDEPRQVNGIADALKGRAILERRYRFGIAADSGVREAWSARCTTTDMEHAIPLGATTSIDLGASLSLECTLYPLAGPASPWNLRVKANEDDEAQGTLGREGETAFTIRGERRPDFEGIARYVVRREGRTIAAADRMGTPTVRLAPDAPEGSPALAAAVALLFHDHIARPD